jgi:hypothetical protein
MRPHSTDHGDETTTNRRRLKKRSSIHGMTSEALEKAAARRTAANSDNPVRSMIPFQPLSVKESLGADLI